MLCKLDIGGTAKSQNQSAIAITRKKNQWQRHVAKSPRKPESNSYQGAPNPSNLDDEEDLEEEVEKEERVFIMLKTIMMMSTISMQ